MIFYFSSTILVSFRFATLSFNQNPTFLVFPLQQSAKEKKAIKETVLAFPGGEAPLRGGKSSR